MESATLEKSPSPARVSFLKNPPPVDPNRKVDAMFFISVDQCNPNGDPDNGNRPRQDTETGAGLISNVSIKRHIRDTVSILTKEPGYEIYVARKAILDHVLREIHDDLGVPKKGKKNGKGEEKEEGPSSKEIRDVEERASAKACKRFYDVRTFGAVMASKEANSGQVRGPIQIGYSKTFDPVAIVEDSIVRLALQTDREAEANFMNQTFGNKFRVPFGLYGGALFFTPHFARQTGFTSADFELLWETMARLFEYSRSSSRDGIAMEQIVTFEHEGPLGNAPTHKLFRALTKKISLKNPGKPPRNIDDYTFPKKEDVVAQLEEERIHGVKVEYLL